MLSQAAQIIYQLREGDVAQKIAAVKEAALYVEDCSYFPEAIPFLLNFLGQKKYPELAEVSASALAKFRDERIVPALITNLNSFHPVIRRSAISALIHFFNGFADRIPSFLKRKIKKMARPRFEKSWEVRAMALFALAVIGRKKVEDLSLKGLKDISWSVRYTACRLLTDLVSQQRIQDWPQALSALEIASEVIPTHLKDLRKSVESAIQPQAYA